MIQLNGARPYPEDALREFCKALPRLAGTSQEAVLRQDYALVLDGLIKTAYDPSIGIAHRGAAINGLCSLVGYADILSIAQPLNETKWLECLNILLDRGDGAKSKPLRQLLICLTNVLASMPTEQRNDVLEQLSAMLVDILVQQSDHVKAKPALQILNYLLAKEILKVVDICRYSTGPAVVINGAGVSAHADTEVQAILETLLSWIPHQETSIAASQAIRTFVQKLPNKVKIDTDFGQPLWVAPLVLVLRNNLSDLSSFRSHLFPDLFKSNVHHYVGFLRLLGLDQLSNPHDNSQDVDGTNSILLFACLEVGKENGLVIESASSELLVHEGTIHLPEAILGNLLVDSVDALRVSGLSLLISSVSTTRPFAANALRCLERNLPNLLMETDVYVRGEVLVHIQRLVDRLKAATAALNKARRSQGDQKLLSLHQKFIRALLRLAADQLHPAAPYQRHIVGLHTLSILAKSGLDKRLAWEHLSKQAQLKEAAVWPFDVQIFDVTIRRLLQDLLIDAFDDIRSLASSLLVMSTSIGGVGDKETNSMFLKRAETLMLSSGRADHADGVSRANAIMFKTSSGQTHVRLLQGLLSDLEQRIALAKENLTFAVSKNPMHGALASVRLIFDAPNTYHEIQIEERREWRALHIRIVAALHDVWDCVQAILCNDAPEGHVPDDMEEEMSITTKDILSYCWRALKESSTLIRVIASRARIGSTSDSMVSDTDFERLCRLMFHELLELRHRGAFSAVAQGFAACCARASVLNHNDLLEGMFVETLLAIRAKGSATTRRSAGLPSAIVGILSASPSSPLFRRAIVSLLHESSQPTNGVTKYGDSLPQVHALNCLRSIFINATLGQCAEPYTAQCLALAGNCLTSDVWAIRNCGLMFFRALIDRLLGSADSSNWSDEMMEPSLVRASFDDFPNLLEIVFDLLTPDEKQLTSPQRALESVFPAMKLLQRMPPPANRRYDTQTLVLRLCSSPHWHIRDMAARTFALLTLQEDRLSVASKLVPRLDLEQNLIHGQLLCITWLTKMRFCTAPTDTCGVDELECALVAASELDTKNKCPITRAAYLDVLNMIDLHWLRCGSNVIPKSTPSHWDITTVLQELPSTRTSRALHLLLRNYIPAYTGQLNGRSKDDTSISDSELAGYLLWLQVEDPQIALRLFELLVENIALLPTQPINIIAHCLSIFSIHADGRDLHQVSANRALLVRVLHAMPDSVRALNPALTGEDMKMTFASAITPPPSLVENTILLWGMLAKQAYFAVGYIDVSLCATLREMVAVLRPFINEHQPFDLRSAAARCLQSLSSIWTAQFSSGRAKQHADRTKVALILLVYDQLNDDDSEIRDIAADVAAIILTAQEKSDGVETPRTRKTVSLEASRLLLCHMTTRYPHVPLFLENVISRMIGLHSHPSAHAAFTAACATDTALFAVEKQNLFVDEVRETILWTQAFKSIPSSTILNCSGSASLLRTLSKWTREALDLMHAKLAGQEGEDGVLGWASKADMFIFGMRLWCVVDATFAWRTGIGRTSDELLAEMVEIYALAETRDCHPLWLQKMRQVLAREMRGRMRNGEVKKRMTAILTIISSKH